MSSLPGSDGSCTQDISKIPRPPDCKPGNELLCRASVITARSWRSQPVPRGVAGTFCRLRWLLGFARSEAGLCISI